MRSVLTILFLSITISQVKAQSAKEYILPALPVNKVLYSVPESSMTRSKSYIDNDSVLIIIDSVFVQGSYSNSTTYSLKFVGNEVHLIQSIDHLKLYQPKNIDYNPPLVLLKLPASNGTEKWTTYDPEKEITTNYIASWEEVTFKGAVKKMLRVEKSFNHTRVKEAEYYFIGIGLLNAEVLVGSSKMQKLKLEGTEEIKITSK